MSIKWWVGTPPNHDQETKFRTFPPTEKKNYSKKPKRNNYDAEISLFPTKHTETNQSSDCFGVFGSIWNIQQWSVLLSLILLCFFIGR